MHYWVREIAGWLLVLLALYMIRMGISYVSDPEEARVVEAGVILLSAMGVLRAGILLVRVATAARICTKDDA